MDGVNDLRTVVPSQDKQVHLSKDESKLPGKLGNRQVSSQAPGTLKAGLKALWTKIKGLFSRSATQKKGRLTGPKLTRKQCQDLTKLLKKSIPEHHKKQYAKMLVTLLPRMQELAKKSPDDFKDYQALLAVAKDKGLLDKEITAKILNSKILTPEETLGALKAFSEISQLKDPEQLKQNQKAILDQLKNHLISHLKNAPGLSSEWEAYDKAPENEKDIKLGALIKKGIDTLVKGLGNSPEDLNLKEHLIGLKKLAPEHVITSLKVFVETGLTQASQIRGNRLQSEMLAQMKEKLLGQVENLINLDAKLDPKQKSKLASALKAYQDAAENKKNEQLGILFKTYSDTMVEKLKEDLRSYKPVSRKEKNLRNSLLKKFKETGPQSITERDLAKMGRLLGTQSREALNLVIQAKYILKGGNIKTTEYVDQKIKDKVKTGLGGKIKTIDDLKRISEDLRFKTKDDLKAMIKTLEYSLNEDKKELEQKKKDLKTSTGENKKGVQQSIKGLKNRISEGQKEVKRISELLKTWTVDSPEELRYLKNKLKKKMHDLLPVSGNDTRINEMNKSIKKALQRDMFIAPEKLKWEMMTIKKKIGKGGGGATIFDAGSKLETLTKIRIKMEKTAPQSKERLKYQMLTEQLNELTWNVNQSRSFVFKCFQVGGIIDNSKNTEEFEKEFSISKRLNHPNIVNVHFSLEAMQQNRVGIVMDYCKKGDLTHVLEKDKNLPKEERQFDPETSKGVKNIAKMILGTLKGLHYLHQAGIVHRDMKPENIFVTDDNTPKVGDFGISKKIDTLQKGLSQKEKNKAPSPDTKRVGTSLYMPPEVTKGDYKSSSAQDAYSLGMTALVAMFKGNTKKIMGQTFNFEVYMSDKDNAKQSIDKWLGGDGLPDTVFDKTEEGRKLRNFIRQSMMYNPNDRISYENSVKMLEDIIQ